MCGIVGYVGNRLIKEVLINGLEKLEYRGYDSSGIALINENDLEVIKCSGRIDNLKNKLINKSFISNVGIAHTRWATHGDPTDANSHPHFNAKKTIAIVHNGIVENYNDIKKELIASGYTFITDTDSEIICHLLDKYMEDNFLVTIQRMIARLNGSYALGIITLDKPDCLYAVRNGSPLVIGIGKGDNFIASDVSALIQYTKKVCYLDNGEIAEIKSNEVIIRDKNLNLVNKSCNIINWDIDITNKNGFSHYMLKEISEQPKVARDILTAYIDHLDINIDLGDITDFCKVAITACGTAYYAAMNAKTVFEYLLEIPVDVYFASEFRYGHPLIDKDSLVIVISQSGETADTLAALRLAKDKGSKTLALVNVRESTIAREADKVIYTLAGNEIAVASTKAFVSQLLVMYLLGLQLAKNMNVLNNNEIKEYILELNKIPSKIEEILDYSSFIEELATCYSNVKNAYFIGRGIDYTIALEGALKLKETTYIHAEGYAAGELKHGPISLIEKNTLVVALSTNTDIEHKMASNIKEVMARGADVLLVGINSLDFVKSNILIPNTNKLFCSILSVIPLQLFAYYIAKEKGLDVDKPRNLAKSVTVE